MTTKHIIKLWVLTLLVAPFIYAIYDLYYDIDGQVITLLEVYPISIIFSITFSIPTLITAWLLNKKIKKLKINDLLNKLIILALTIFGLITTLFMIGGSLIPVLTYTYTASLIISFVVWEIIEKIKFYIK